MTPLPHRALRPLLVLGAALLLAAAAPLISLGQPLVLEATILLPKTLGRLDHLDLDTKRSLLLVAEYGNNTLDVVDWQKRDRIRRLSGFNRPQGVAYDAKDDLFMVSNGGDGTLRFLSAATYRPLGSLSLGSDADNILIDPRTHLALVGHDHGAIALVDPARRARIADIPLPAHPEGMAIDAASGKLYVNVPDAHEIDVIDLDHRTVSARWRNLRASGNYPLALEPDGRLLAVVYRDPPLLVLYDRDSGAEIGDSPACRDADGVFFDAAHKQIYATCGSGEIGLFTIQPGQRGGYFAAPPIPTAPGARTGLFVPALGRLFIARPAGSIAATLPHEIATYLLDQSVPGPNGTASDTSAALLVYRAGS